MLPSAILVDTNATSAKRFPQGPTCTVTDPHSVFYSDMSLEAAQPYIDQLTPICLQAFEQGCPADCYSDSVPSTYLITMKDECLPSFAQETMVKNIGERCKVERCDTGHSPFLSQPELVTRLVRRVAGESAQVDSDKPVSSWIRDNVRAKSSSRF